MTPNALPFPYRRGLWRALAMSVALHAALLASGLRLPAPFAPPPAPALNVRLAQAAPVPVPQPELRLPEDTPPARPADAKHPPAAKRLTRPAEAAPAPRPAGVQALSGEAARLARAQVARELLYPLEAIDRGLEGEVLVMLFLDEAGNAIAARVEASSGHAILDEAAVRAARTVRALPSSAPREALLPVRFRLR